MEKVNIFHLLRLSEDCDIIVSDGKRSNAMRWMCNTDIRLSLCQCHVIIMAGHSMTKKTIVQ
ncbi:hypothetical protein ACTXT7_007051 [Hymenolepis weldensis]